MYALEFMLFRKAFASLETLLEDNDFMQKANFVARKNANIFQILEDKYYFYLS